MIFFWEWLDNAANLIAVAAFVLAAFVLVMATRRGQGLK